MKILCYIFFGCFFFQLSGFAQQKRALVVAISEYPKHTGWNRIHADNDLKILIPILEKQGFLKKNSIVLENEQATKDNIIQALKTLEQNCKKGDLVYIHFSCHGQQMEDDNGDEPDGLDESLIPYDAQMHFRKGKYEGEKHLRDDELDVFLLAIRKKLKDNGNLIVSLDACHSQSGDRGEDEEEVFVRGTSAIFSQQVGYKGKISDNQVDTPLVQAEGLAPITIISACMSYQKNYEYKAEDNYYYGILTYSICSIGKQYPILTSSNQWLDEVEKLMKKKTKLQIPVIETTLHK